MTDLQAVIVTRVARMVLLIAQCTAGRMATSSATTTIDEGVVSYEINSTTDETATKVDPLARGLGHEERQLAETEVEYTGVDDVLGAVHVVHLLWVDIVAAFEGHEAAGKRRWGRRIDQHIPMAPVGAGETQSYCISSNVSLDARATESVRATERN